MVEAIYKWCDKYTDDAGQGEFSFDEMLNDLQMNEAQLLKGLDELVTAKILTYEFSSGLAIGRTIIIDLLTPKYEHEKY